MFASARSTFRRLNLMEAWPFNGKFDAIFCRNVMIYFDGPTKTALVERFTQKLKPGGWLYIGHSESLIGSHPGLRACRPHDLPESKMSGVAALRRPADSGTGDER